MKLGIELACGEVPWERQLLEAIDRSNVFHVVRRYVDVAAITEAAKSRTIAHVLLMTPAVRGFEAKAVQALAEATRVVVLIDTIRPPWLEQSMLDCRELSSIQFSSLLEELEAAGCHDDVASCSSATGRLTVFAGASGGVGTTSLAWAHAVGDPSALVVDANVRAPTLGFLAGMEVQSASLLAATTGLAGDPDTRLREHVMLDRLLTLPLAGAPDLMERDALVLADAARSQFAHTIADVGCVTDDGFAAALVGQADRLVLVTTAAPSGVLRLPDAVVKVRRDGLELGVVINRFRNSAAGSRQGRTAMRRLVERACGLCPTFVDENPEAFDRAWLSGEWRDVCDALPKQS